MQRFSFRSLIRHGLNGQDDLAPMWRCPDPKSSYDVVIVGAGGPSFGQILARIELLAWHPT